LHVLFSRASLKKVILLVLFTLLVLMPFGSVSLGFEDYTLVNVFGDCKEALSQIELKLEDAEVAIFENNSEARYPLEEARYRLEKAISNASGLEMLLLEIGEQTLAEKITELRENLTIVLDRVESAIECIFEGDFLQAKYATIDARSRLVDCLCIVDVLISYVRVPKIGEPVQEPSQETVQPNVDVIVRVNVTDYGGGISGVSLFWSVDNGVNWIAEGMAEVASYYLTANYSWSGIDGGGVINIEYKVCMYAATIPGQENDTLVLYKIITCNPSGENSTEDNNGMNYQYHVVPEYSSFTILITLAIFSTIITILIRRKKLCQSPL